MTRELPRGPHGLDAALVSSAQRTRLLDAMAAAVAARGYGDTTVADVIGLAGVSRKTFYEQFANKQDCFLAAFDHASERVGAAVVTATLAADDADDRLQAGYRALLGALADMPDYARTFAIVAAEAGPAAQRRRAAWTDESVARIQMLYAASAADTPELPAELPEFVARMIVGAGDALIIDHIERFGATTLTELAPPLIGATRALMYAPIEPPLRVRR